MPRNLHPTEGARFLLERSAGEPDDGATAVYAATIYTPDRAFSVTARLGEDGRIDLPSMGAPADLEERMHTIAKLLARDAPKRRDDGLVVWPARILRWRR